MPEWLLVFASVNLALGAAVVLPPLIRHARMSRRRGLTLAGVPTLWAMVIVGAYLYLRATIPPSPVIGYLPDGTPLVRHGNVDWMIWDEHVSSTIFLAFCLTVATLLSVAVMWLAYSVRAWRRHAHFA